MGKTEIRTVVHLCFLFRDRTSDCDVWHTRRCRSSSIHSLVVFLLSLFLVWLVERNLLLWTCENNKTPYFVWCRVWPPISGTFFTIWNGERKNGWSMGGLKPNWLINPHRFFFFFVFFFLKKKIISLIHRHRLFFGGGYTLKSIIFLFYRELTD